ncbi:MAG: lipopolysaccharide biosynthesis protein [Stomatobaculum sp.]
MTRQAEGREFRRSVTRGLLWKLSELAGAQGVQFAVALILARLMTPREYGTIGLIMIFITIANVFVQSGFATALIQAPEVREEDYSSVCRVSLLISVPVYLVLWACAPLAAAYYETPLLSALLRVMGVVLFPGAVISVQTARVARGLAFRRLFEATMFAVLLSGVISVIMAFLRFGVWAMAAQQLIYYFGLMTGLFFTVRWRPGAAFDGRRVKRLFRFSWKILLSGLIDTVWMNLYGLMIGKRYSQADLGGYNRGEQFPKLIASNLAAAIQSVLLPTYAQHQGEPAALKQMMRRSVRLSAFGIFPMMAGLAGCAEPLVRVLLTERWLFCVPYLRVMCLCYAFWPVHVTNLQMVTALGRSDLFLKLEIAKKLLGVVILLLSLRFGVVGMLLLKALDEFLCTFLNALPVRRLIGYGIGAQYMDMLAPAVCALLMGAGVWQIERCGFPAGATLLAQIGAGVLLYALLSWLFNRESLHYVTALLYQRRSAG